MTEVLMLADRELLTRLLAKKQEVEALWAFVEEHLKESYALQHGDAIDDDFTIRRVTGNESL